MPPKGKPAGRGARPKGSAAGQPGLSKTNHAGRRGQPAPDAAARTESQKRNAPRPRSGRGGGSQAAGPAREAAHRILLRVSEDGAWASRLLEAVEDEFEDRRDLALTHTIVLGVLRWRARIDHDLERASGRRVEALDPPVREALRLGVYQLRHLDRIPAHAAVNGSVAIARRTSGRGAAGLVNAVLRRISIEETESRAGDPERQGGSRGDRESIGAVAVALSHPEWMVARALDRWPRQDALGWLASNNEPAPVTLRPNPLHPAHAHLAERLREEGVAVEPAELAPGALNVLEGHSVRTRLFSEGAFWIQDAGSQLVPLLFPPPWSGISADLCAAPGGKAFALACGSPKGRVAAFDLHPHRLTRLAQGASRLCPGRIAAAAADMAQGPPAGRGTFDRVLVDAPCSGTGVLRRHPEIRWRLDPAHLPELAALQGRLLDSAFELVRPGGFIVYSVCSVEREEGDGVLDAFLARSGCRVVDPRPHLPGPAREVVGEDGRLRTFPNMRGGDGFFAALVSKP